jgi:hypothetical protein
MQETKESNSQLTKKQQTSKGDAEGEGRHSARIVVGREAAETETGNNLAGETGIFSGGGVGVAGGVDDPDVVITWQGRVDSERPAKRIAARKIHEMFHR